MISTTCWLTFCRYNDCLEWWSPAEAEMVAQAVTVLSGEEVWTGAAAWQLPDRIVQWPSSNNYFETNSIEMPWNFSSKANICCEFWSSSPPLVSILVFFLVFSHAYFWLQDMLIPFWSINSFWNFSLRSRFCGPHFHRAPNVALL